MRKILYSPDYGAGWSSWNSGDAAKYMLEYQPILDFIESGNKFTDEECDSSNINKMHPLLRQLQEECKEKFNTEYVCLLGAISLEVKQVRGRIRINEYDGYESVEEEGDINDWM